MSRYLEPYRQLIELIERQLEQRISPADFAQLENLIRDDAQARRIYREYLDLHGMLHWGTALTERSESGPAGSVTAETAESISAVSSGAAASIPAVPVPSAAEPLSPARPTDSAMADPMGIEPPVAGPAVADPAAAKEHRRGRSLPAVVALCAAVVVAVAVFLTGQDDIRNDLAGESGPNALPRDGDPQGESLEGQRAGAGRPGAVPGNGLLADAGRPDRRRSVDGPVKLPERELPETDGGRERRGDAVEVAEVAGGGSGATVDQAQVPGSSDRLPSERRLESGTHAIVPFINERIREGWWDAEVAASPRSDDAEWIRRVSLDIVGHIPTAERVTEFLADDRDNKRALLIDELLEDEDYIRNWTTVWTNLLVGRSNPRGINRDALQKFLRDSFAENRGWDDIVADFISAEGSADQNGATNFLIAHVNNEAVPATAITAKLFLGLQIQCTQCHNHPFNDKTQEEFWAFNSFFQQIDVQRQPMADNPRVQQVVLMDRPEGGPTFYETRNGLMKAAFPRFEGQRIDEAETVNRRDELARLMTTGEAPQMARAFVNRMWQHFFGAGFTPVVDDMGPHATVSHPEVLDGLTREFVRSGYDIRQLIRWICRTEAYSLTSRFGESNAMDDPSIGELPLFSRVYVKPMTVEQLFDSLLIATRAREVFGSDWNSVEQRRQDWLQQFVMAWNTDENDEADLFDGTIPQALMLMNGELIRLSLESDRNTYLDQVLRSRNSENEKIRAIALAALSRPPSRTETAAVRRMMRERAARRAAGEDPSGAVRGSLQDYFWACLNSNEFILIH